MTIVAVRPSTLRTVSASPFQQRVDAKFPDRNVLRVGIAYVKGACILRTSDTNAGIAARMTTQDG